MIDLSAMLLVFGAGVMGGAMNALAGGVGVAPLPLKGGS